MPTSHPAGRSIVVLVGLISAGQSLAPAVSLTSTRVWGGLSMFSDGTKGQPELPMVVTTTSDESFSQVTVIPSAPSAATWAKNPAVGAAVGSRSPGRIGGVGEHPDSTKHPTIATIHKRNLTRTPLSTLTNESGNFTVKRPGFVGGS